MKKQSKFQKPAAKFKPSKKVIVLASIAGALVLVIAGMLIALSMGNEQPVETLPTEDTTPTTEVTTEATEDTTEASTEESTAETEPVMLAHMAELYAKNPDIFGWITIEGTKVDYPLMYTPYESMKYLYANFEGKFQAAGLPFIDGACSVDPESDNLIIHGHNMKSGAAFAAILGYAEQDFYEKHPVVHITTLYEERTYEVVAAFYDRIYQPGESGFIYYQFINAHTEADFIEAAAYYRANNLLDTGIELEYGDKLITLATCSHHMQDGRFVVIARLVTDDTEPGA